MTAAPRTWRRVVALSGGVGGARFVHGLDQVLPPGVLTAIVNTGDDFEHWGLPVSPDLDTVMYTLAGMADAERGWGIRDETFRALEGVRAYGGDTWFALGDRDLATHLVRGQRLSAGQSLSEVTAGLCSALGVGSRLLPMTDDSLQTCVETEALGTLGFQDWLVRHRAPAVRRITFVGDARPAPGVLEALRAAEAVLVAPSNPYVSIDPILDLAGVRDAVAGRVVVGVSPIIGSRAVKGPLAAMIPALSGAPSSGESVARHYGGLLAGWVVHEADACDVTGLAIARTDILMPTVEDRIRVARAALDLAGRLVDAR
jgi:LPPG:FO 2-phospho-L-lactate transferase